MRLIWQSLLSVLSSNRLLLILITFFLIWYILILNYLQGMFFFLIVFLLCHFFFLIIFKVLFIWIWELRVFFENLLILIANLFGFVYFWVGRVLLLCWLSTIFTWTGRVLLETWDLSFHKTWLSDHLTHIDSVHCGWSSFWVTHYLS